MTTGASAFAFLVLQFDERVLAGHEVATWWLFEGGAEGARGVLTTIAGTMMTVVTTAFSITIVALQLSSTQFSPRILKSFTSDRGNQLVLGTFIATFAYTVVVLRSIRSELADQESFVPATAVTVAIVLSFAAIGSLIYFFHHASRVIQASVVIDRAAQETFALIDARLDQDAGRAAAEPVTERVDVFGIGAVQSGYVTSIDTDRLLQCAGTHGVVVTVCAQVGDHLLSSATVATVPLASIRRLSDERLKAFAEEIQRAIKIGVERTMEFDLLLGFRQLTDIAIKALSPGINDPTTATSAIDRMGEGWLRLRDARAETWFAAAASGEGGVRQTVVGFDQVLDQCLPQIRHFAAGDVVVVVHLLDVLRQVSRGVSAEVAELISGHVAAIVASASHELTLDEDRERVRNAAAWAQR